MINKVEIYCDGATSHNGYEDSIGGYGWIMLCDGEVDNLSGGQYEGATNQMMELWAAISALRQVSNKYDKGEINNNTQIIVYTDSAYLHNCYTQKWYLRWRVNGWKNSKGEPVANKNYWELLVPYFSLNNITFIKVKGHKDNKYNNIADEIAVTARKLSIEDFLFYKKERLQELRNDRCDNSSI